MKIIDKNKGKTKRKDYYDYLTGIYGIDEKLVLDRRNYSNLLFPPSYLRFFIAGYIIEGLNVGGKFYYGNDLDKFKTKDGQNRYFMSRHWVRDYEKSILVQYEDDRICKNWIYKEPIPDPQELNVRFDCPILMDAHPTWKDHDLVEYPLLKDFNLNKHIPAEKIYRWLSEWLGNRITAREQSPELSNDGKIEAKGFDKKVSFRHRK